MFLCRVSVNVRMSVKKNESNVAAFLIAFSRVNVNVRMSVKKNESNVAAFAFTFTLILWALLGLNQVPSDYESDALTK